MGRVWSEARELGLPVLYSCVPPTIGQQDISYDNDSMTEWLNPNTDLTFNFESRNLHRLTINLNTSSPIDGELGRVNKVLSLISGFVAVRSADGQWVVGLSKLDVVLDSKTTSSQAKVVQWGGAGAELELSWELGEDKTTPVPTTSTTTPPPHQPVSIFILAVPEEDWVANNLQDFKVRFKAIISYLSLRAGPNRRDPGRSLRAR